MGITTYKGTDKDMKCYGGFQYELGKTFKDDGAIRCGDKGFHSCEVPMNVFEYFPAANGNRFFEAETGGTVDNTGANDSKIASSELTLKAEIGIPGIIKAQMEYVRRACEKATEETASGESGNAAASGWRGNAAASGWRGNAAASGVSGNAAASGWRGNAAASGERGNAAASGWRGNAAASGWRGNAAASGWSGNAAASGERGNAAASGWSGNAAASGWRGNAAASGESGNAAASGVSGNAAASGESGNAAASGWRGAAVSSGYLGSAEANGVQCIAIGWGEDSKVRGVVGCWLVIAEYENDIIKTAAMAKVDGEIIKADTWYKLVNGEFVEVQDEDD